MPHPVVTFEQDRYLVNGVEYPRVTEILAVAGLVDYSWTRPEHLHRGTAVHMICDLIDDAWSACSSACSSVPQLIQISRWDPETTDPKLVPYGLSYAQWLISHQPKWTLREQIVASLVYRFAGRLDRYGVLPSGKRILVDIKSGLPTIAAGPQLALYGLALEETYGLKHDEHFALAVSPHGRIAKPHPGGPDDLKVGLAAVTLYHYRRKHGRIAE